MTGAVGLVGPIGPAVGPGETGAGRKGGGGESISAVKSSRSLANSASNASSSGLNAFPLPAEGGVLGAGAVKSSAGAFGLLGRLGDGFGGAAFGTSSSVNQSSSSLPVDAIPGARKVCWQ